VSGTFFIATQDAMLRCFPPRPPASLAGASTAGKRMLQKIFNTIQILLVQYNGFSSHHFIIMKYITIKNCKRYTLHFRSKIFMA
jgi:hypothetical protein